MNPAKRVRWQDPIDQLLTEAMGSGTPLERLESRQVVKINLNILKGCALLMRANFLRHAGAPIPRNMGEWIPALDP